MESNKKEGGIVQLVVVLGLITFICALLLGVINGVTADKIAQNAVETRDAAMAEIIPDAEFEDMNTALSADEVAAAGVTLPAGRTAAQIDGVYKATKDGEEVGYCVQVEPKGFGGNVTMIVGINADGTVAGAKVTSHAETPGLGAKSQADPNWITQYAGQAADGQLQVSLLERELDKEIVGIYARDSSVAHVILMTIRRTVLHLTYDTNQLWMQAMDTEVDGCALTGLDDLMKIPT